jgi:catechol 2,3-dioxygenase-like lactoylglutathione lyase family enzyme
VAARAFNVVIDCPDPRALAEFYAKVLGLEVTTSEVDWVTIGKAPTRIGFQQAPDLKAPNWPDPEHPQQMHLDIRVDDLAAADREVRELGATRLPGEGDDFWVYADPAGHPFCLIF